MDFAEELHFWMIRDFHMEVCCAENYNLRRAQLVVYLYIMSFLTDQV